MARAPDRRPDNERAEAVPAWARLHLWQMQPVRDVLVGLGVVGLFWLGQATSIVTVPLLLAILLAYLFEPVIAWMVRRGGFSRPGAVSTVIGALAVLVVVPATLGLTYGVVQVVGLAGRVTSDAQLVLETFDRQTRARNSELAYRAAAEQPHMSEAPGILTQEGRAGDQGPVSNDAGADQNEAGPDAKEEDPEEPDEDAPALEEVDPQDGAGLVAAQRRELEERDARERVLTTTPEELEALRLAAEEAWVEAQTYTRRVELEAGRPWPWILEQLVERGDDHGIDEAVRLVRGWIRDNIQQVALTTATAGATAVRTVAIALGRLLGLGFLLFLTAFFFFFLSTGWAGFKRFVGTLLPDKHRSQIVEITLEFDRVISAFVRGRLTIAFIQSIVFTLGYWAIGVPAAFLLGPAVALLSIVPYLALVGLPVSVSLLWLEGHSGLRGNLLWVIGAPTVLYFMGQALDDYVLTPLIQGKETGLDTPVILFASLAGGALFGVFGLLIAIPIAACLKIVIQRIFWPRFKAWLEGRTRDPLPIE